MNISVAQIFTDKNAEIFNKVSYKVDFIIKEKLIELAMKKKLILNIPKDYFLFFRVDLNDKISNVKVSKLSIDEKYQTYQFIIKIPNNIFTDHKYVPIIYIEQTFEGLKKILPKYEFNIDELETIKLDLIDQIQTSEYWQENESIIALSILNEDNEEFKEIEEPYTPIEIDAVESIYKGQPTISYSITLEPNFDEDYIETIENFGFDVDGYLLEIIFLQYFDKTNPQLIQQIRSFDTESAAFVAYADTSENQHKIAAEIQKLLTSKKLLKNFLKENLKSIKKAIEL